mgnify:FL=1
MNDYDMEALYERLSRQRLDDVAKHDDPIDRLHLLIICLAERNQISAMRIIRLEKRIELLERLLDKQ